MGTHTLCIGLTGGIGSGKSTAAQYFKTLGATTLSADQYARDCLRPHTSHWQWLVDTLGTNILHQDNTIDRDQLRQLCIETPNLKTTLEQRLHPEILEKIQHTLQTPTQHYYLIEIPLLFETHWTLPVNRVCVVDATEAQQIQRTLKRNTWTEIQIHVFMKHQLSRAERIQASDDILNNTGTLPQLEQHVRQLHDRYIALSLPSIET